MVNLRVAVRRITVENNQDLSPLAIAVNDLTQLVDAHLRVVTIKANSIVYDVFITYNDGGTSANLELKVKSNYMSVGDPITDDVLFDIGSPPENKTDIHVRDFTNGRSVSNILSVAIV